MLRAKRLKRIVCRSPSQRCSRDHPRDHTRHSSLITWRGILVLYLSAWVKQ
jgi:hypothetical protein